jgi:hypothetical protein
MLSWIATAVLAMLAGYSVWLAAVGFPTWMGYAAAIYLAFAALLMFPPLWRRSPQSRWHYVRIFVVVVITGTVLLLPIKTHAVLLEMPNPASPSHH